MRRIDDHDRKHTALRELGEADRAYRAAFDQLTSLGGLEPSTFDRLLASVTSLREVVTNLRDGDDGLATMPVAVAATASKRVRISGRSEPRSRRRRRSGV